MTSRFFAAASRYKFSLIIYGPGVAFLAYWPFMRDEVNRARILNEELYSLSRLDKELQMQRYRREFDTEYGLDFENSIFTMKEPSYFFRAMIRFRGALDKRVIGILLKAYDLDSRVLKNTISISALENSEETQTYVIEDTKFNDTPEAPYTGKVAIAFKSMNTWHGRVENGICKDGTYDFQGSGLDRQYDGGVGECSWKREFWPNDCIPLAFVDPADRAKIYDRNRDLAANAWSTDT